ncbi:type IV secretion protein Rhs [Pedobacter sp. PAMC26386]|nr:type IV secretion protein Rhs [Pedobacter sp. PAMC26386]
MENKVKVEINIEGTPVSTFSSFNLHQCFNEHHTFELRFNQDQIELPGVLSLKRSKEFIGKSLTIEFGDIPGKENRFSGVITKVEISQAHGFMGDIIVSGFSPTILIDRGPDLGSYLGKDLKNIIGQITKGVPANDLYMKINPNRKEIIDYVIQYRESDFEFMNRLSAQYHEWFLYNGTSLVFGKPDELKEVKLIYGRDLSNIQYGMEIAPLNHMRYAYHPKDDELLAAKSEMHSSRSADKSHVIAASNSVYSKTYNQPLRTRADSKMEIDRFVKNEQESISSGLVHITGIGDNPQVSIGGIADISMSVRKVNDFAIEDFGKFLITEITHHINGVGLYRNTFQAISADTERVPVNKVHNPQPEMQFADVIANNDPDGQGRVKVQFKWTCSCNDVSEWLRVVTPDAGGSEKVSKNRGFVFIPEIGDQVMVAFEEGNVARPIVMGSVFHGKNGAGGGSANVSKSITSRSGHTIELNDGGSGTHIIIRDPSGNEIFLDTSGKNITITSPETITLNAKNIVMNADQNITSTAGVNVSTSAGATVSTAAGSNIQSTAAKDFTMMATNIIGTADDNVTHNATNSITKRGRTIEASATESDFKLYSAKKVVNTSGEKGKLF